MPTKQQLIAQAKLELQINVPIYRVDTLPDGGLRFYLYGHYTPVDWSPAPPTKPTRKSQIPRSPAGRPKKAAT